MTHVVAAIDIASPADRVWRALCDPHEVVQWDTGVTAALDAPSDYPQPGQHVRWSYRSRLFPVLHDRPQDVVPERRLRSLLALGPWHYDETYTLEPIDTATTRLTLTFDLTTAIPVIGPLLTRLYLTPTTRTAAIATLASIKCHS